MMDSVTLSDILNVLVPVIGGLSVIIYSLIKLHVDVGHIKKQITTLFDLHNNKREKD